MERCKGVKKLTENRFLNLYEIDARTNSETPFSYYFASRNSEENLKLKTKQNHPEGIVIYALLKEEPEKIVLIRQYRYPLDTYLYELPAGLVDAGETPEQAAIREMKEETGLSLEVYQGGADFLREPFFIGPGFTDESSTSVFGFVEGNVSKSFCEDTESIEVVFANKTMVREILQKERVSLRAGLLLMNFLQRKEGQKPFEFLEI